MDWPMFYSGQPYVAEAGNVFFIHIIVFDAAAGLEFKGFGRPITMRAEDNQGLEAQLVGVTKADPAYNFMVLDNMKDILEKLPSDQFIRIHRSYIIPTDKIKLIEGNQIQLHNQEFVPIGETYRKVVSEWLEGK